MGTERVCAGILTIEEVLVVDGLKPWKCEHQHVLGQVRRNGSGIRQLILYREAVDLEADEVEEVDVIAIVEGHVMDVRCSICGSSRTWVPGQEAVAKAIARDLEQVGRRPERNSGKQAPFMT